LPGLQLAQASSRTILIDPNAAGFGWFVDRTPRADEEFTGSANMGNLVAFAGGPAAGRMDLLTVVMHELAHVLGYDHSDSGLMRPTLEPGIRRLWQSHDPTDDDHELADWETLLDDQPLDETSLDAYFAALG